MSTIPRDLFVPAERRSLAYIDEDVAIGNGRYLMEPVVLARLIQEAEVTAKDLVLVVGCASGYSAAVLSKLAGTVVALESDKALAERASAAMRELAIDNVVVLEGPLPEGREDQGPFQVILLDGAVDEVPAALIDQLADGGRLVGVVGTGRIGRGTILTRAGAAVSRRTVFDATIHRLPNFAKEPGFVF
jgi:protein-L-isoaspartate(D-aspartate) O-methyltransferase